MRHRLDDLFRSARLNIIHGFYMVYVQVKDLKDVFTRLILLKYNEAVSTHTYSTRCHIVQFARELVHFRQLSKRLVFLEPVCSKCEAGYVHVAAS
jgi:hypothetical protein